MTTQLPQADEKLESHNDRLGKLSAMAKVGVALILLSGVFFASLFAVPFLPVGVGAKVLLAGVLYLGMQIAWWAGVALAGSSAIGRIRSSIKRCLPGQG